MWLRLLLARLAPGCARAAPSLLKIRSATSHCEATNRKPHRGKSRHRNPESPSFAPGPNDLRKHRGGSGVRHSRAPRPGWWSCSGCSCRDRAAGPCMPIPLGARSPLRFAPLPGPPPWRAVFSSDDDFARTNRIALVARDRVDPKRGGVRLGRPQLGAARDQSHHPRRRRCTGHAIDHHRVQSPGRTDRTHGAGGR